MGPTKFHASTLLAHLATVAAYRPLSNVPAAEASECVFRPMVEYALRFRDVRFHHFHCWHGRNGEYVLSGRKLAGIYPGIQVLMLTDSGPAVPVVHLAGAFVGYAF